MVAERMMAGILGDVCVWVVGWLVMEMSGCDCLDVGVFGWYVGLVVVGEEEEGAGVRRWTG